MNNKYIYLLLLAIFAVFVSEGIFSNIFSNYVQSLDITSADVRGNLELPREIPGILSMFAVGALFFLRENQVAAFASFLLAFGVGALAFLNISSSITVLVILILIASLGQHILITIVDSIVIHIAKPENRGLRLGQMRGLVNAANLAGSAYLWLKWEYINKSYSVDLFVSCALAFLAVLMFLAVKENKLPGKRSLRDTFIIRRHYSLYYILEVFFGARKQVFITFGFWVIVSVLGKQPDYIAKIMLVAAVLGLFFKPFTGKLIQKYGERLILVADSILLFFVCLVYAFSLKLFSHETAATVISICFIVDNLLFAAGAARVSYLGRIAEDKNDVTPTLYTGMAINHVTSIAAAVFGGYLWTLTGSHICTFLFAAVLAIFSGLTARRIAEVKT